MTINLKLDTKAINDVAKLYRKDHQRALTKAVRRSIVRTLPGYQKLAIDTVKGKYRLKVSSIRSMMRLFKKVKGNNIDSMFGAVQIRAKKFGLIEFVKGSKEPRKQKGIKVSKRKGLKIEIRRGKIIKTKGRFIAKTKGTSHVFRRDPKGSTMKQGKVRTSLPLKRQTVPSPIKIFREIKITDKLSQIIGHKYQNEFERNFKFYVDQITNKMK